jgi:ParB family chromosome partitioning protein
MKAADRLRQQFGAHMTESMGPATPAAEAGTIPLPGGVVHGGPAAKYQGAARVKDALAIELGRIVPDPDQPRKDFDRAGLEDLAASLGARGQLQPIRVRWDEPMGKWVIIAGERRWRAAQLAGLETLLCVEAKGPLTPDDILEDQLVENCVREDLNDVDKAHAFRALMDRRGLSQRQLAELLHISHQTVGRALALLAAAPEVQAAVASGEAPASVAAELARSTVDHDEQRAVLAEIRSKGLTRDAAVEAIRGKGKAKKGRGARPKARQTSRVVRTATARVSVELRKGSGPGAFLEALEAATAIVRAEVQGKGAEAA